MTNPDLLRTILTYPFDDAPRMVYADWLEENGEELHAELIRVQCALTCSCVPLSPPDGTGIRSGLLCAACLMEPSRRIGLQLREKELLQTRYALEPNIHFERGFVSTITTQLDVFMSMAENWFNREPITYVRLNDRRPHQVQYSEWHNGAGRFGWYGSDLSTDAALSHIGDRLFGCLPGGYNSRYRFLGYLFEQEANNALSVACVRYGRQLAGLLQIDLPYWRPDGIDQRTESDVR